MEDDDSALLVRKFQVVVIESPDLRESLFKGRLIVGF